eukprot:TRINITY_DN777956_c0_g1_i1.p1 TRINITY_DN777956_c0_g1~~TRINITY_DN777956_c0_g1_i1.p1  ORF type:complete len:113 (+),score=29.93 TRINITY_DN777956_c0_g1_i1:76-414(+)
MGAHTFEVTKKNFNSKVLQSEVPIVLKASATWCPPCRMLAPVMEKLADEFEGAFLLAKVDTDAVPTVAQQLGVSGIPAVFMIIDGDVVEQFTGFRPEEEARAWIKKALEDNA